VNALPPTAEALNVETLTEIDCGRRFHLDRIPTNDPPTKFLNFLGFELCGHWYGIKVMFGTAAGRG
jgi:hypothetical protein